MKPVLLDEPVRACKLQMMRTKLRKPRIKGYLLTGLSAKTTAFICCLSSMPTVKLPLAMAINIMRWIIYSDAFLESDFFIDTKINEIMIDYANKVVDIESNEIAKI